MPAPVVARAHEIQARLEVSDINQETISQNILEKQKKENRQTDLFHLPQDDLIDELKNLDVLSITPMDALNTLFRLREKARTTLRPHHSSANERVRSDYGRNTQAIFGTDRKDRRGRGGGTPRFRGEGTGGKRHRRGGDPHHGGAARAAASNTCAFRITASGIPAGQIRLAFERHATSKLQTEAELYCIHTLGFRGEALASVAAVAKVTCTTKTADAEFGVRCQVEGGEFTDIRQAASPVGTTFVVEELFYNTPVRRKFLKKPAIEAGLVSDYMLRLILSHPEIAFRFVSQGKTDLP